MRIEIRPRYLTAHGSQRIRIEQDEILVDGLRIGYCGTQRMAPITLLFPIAEATMELIKHELNKRDEELVKDRLITTPPPDEEEEASDDDTLE